MNFGEWLKEKRKNAGLDLKSLSKKAGIDIGAISRIENQKTQATLPTVIQLCRGLNYPYLEFVRDLNIRTKEEFDVDKRKPAQSLGLSEDDIYRLTSVDSDDDIRSFINPWEEKYLGITPLTPDSGWIQSTLIGFYLGESFAYPENLPPSFLENLFRSGELIVREDVGNYLRKIRKSHSITAATLEETRNLSSSVLLRFERGEISSLKLADLIIIQQFLDDGGLFFASCWEAVRFTEGLTAARYSGTLLDMFGRRGLVFEIIALARSCFGNPDYEAFIRGIRNILQGNSK